MGFFGLFIRRRVLTTVLVLMAVIVGGLALLDIGLRRMPDVEFPFATISTAYPGGSPDEIETEISKRIEDAVSSISGIDEMTSFSQSGLSLVMIQFDLDEDIDIKAQDIRGKIDLIREQLPDDAEDPVVQKLDITSSPVMKLALAGVQDANELYRLADEELVTLISQVPGVARVTLAGGQRREVQVRLRARDLRRLKIPIGAVVDALRAANMDMPAGDITQGGYEINVRAAGRVESVDAIAAVEVPTSGSGHVRVGDIADIADTYGEARTASRFSRGTDAARNAVMLIVQAQSGANEVDVAAGVTARLDSMRKLLPTGATLDVVVDDSEFVRGALANVRSNMIIGILLTALTLFLFLRSGRATLIIATVMPTSILVSFALIGGSGFTLNILTLTGLAIVIGVLVNNAILIVDSITDQIQEGLEPVEAAVKGTKDIAIAILSSTATNLVVFLPLAFMGEIIGRFFRELGLTVAYATIVSLVISFTLTPMMCGLLLRRKDEELGAFARLVDGTFGRVSRVWQWGFELLRTAYLHVLDWCLRHRWLTMSAAAASFFVGAGIMVATGMEFQPSSDEGWLRITVQTPVGAALGVTDDAVRAVEEQLVTMPHLDRYVVRVGAVSGFLGGSSEGKNLAEISANFGDRAARKETIEDLMSLLRPKLTSIPSAKIIVQGVAGGPGAAPIEVQLIGRDLDALRALTPRVMDVIAAVPSTSGVAKSYQPGQPELRIDPDRNPMGLSGAQVRGVFLEMRSFIEGATASQFRDGDENYDIKVKLRDEDVAWVEDIEGMYVSSPKTGANVPISEVARIVETAGASLITRKNRRRLISVTAQLTGDRPLSKVMADVRAGIDKLSLPAGVQIDYSGEEEFMKDNFKELFKAMLIAAALTFLCIAGIVESFLRALIIILALPVCLIGVALALLLTGITINMFTLMGIVMLIGMVVNNAIIVLDAAARESTYGIPARRAVRDACAQRFRMILMANMTTVVALIPLSLGRGFGGEIFRPLAIVQMGGILAAAVLSLLVIPAIYVTLCGHRHASE